MKGIRKYRTFLEARLDMYREMWERGFDVQRMLQFFKDYEKFVKSHNLPQTKPLYPPGIYFFKTLKEAQEDEKIREETRKR